MQTQLLPVKQSKTKQSPRLNSLDPHQTIEQAHLGVQNSKEVPKKNKI